MYSRRFWRYPQLSNTYLAETLSQSKTGAAGSDDENGRCAAWCAVSDISDGSGVFCHVDEPAGSTVASCPTTGQRSVFNASDDAESELDRSPKWEFLASRASAKVKPRCSGAWQLAGQLLLPSAQAEELVKGPCYERIPSRTAAGHMGAGEEDPRWRDKPLEEVPR